MKQSIDEPEEYQGISTAAIIENVKEHVNQLISSCSALMNCQEIDPQTRDYFSEKIASLWSFCQDNKAIHISREAALTEILLLNVQVEQLHKLYAVLDPKAYNAYLKRDYEKRNSEKTGKL